MHSIQHALHSQLYFLKWPGLPTSTLRESDSDRRIRNLEECIERQKQEIHELKEAASRSHAQWASGINSGVGYEHGQRCDSSFSGTACPPADGPRYAATGGAYRPPGSGQPQAPPAGASRGRGRRQQPNARLPRDVCSRCMQRGHWRAECTQP